MSIGSRSISPICHQGPVIITTRGLRLRSDKHGQISTDGILLIINNYFPLAACFECDVDYYYWLVTDEVVDVVMLFNILPAPATPCPLKTIRNSK